MNGFLMGFALISIGMDIGEFLAREKAAGRLDLKFQTPQGKLGYHIACHLRAQSIGTPFRAILEASAYAIRDITDQMLRMGLPLEEIRTVGGGARSSLWRQIKADVTGLPVSITETVETTALGAGILALAGSGLFGSITEAVGLTTHVIETRDPHPETSALYDEYYQIYRATYFSLLPVFEQAAKINL